MNHDLLNCLGVGHPALDRIKLLASRYGYHAKLTGAGGGGCSLVYLPPSSSSSSTKSVECEALLQAEGFRCFRVTVGGPGVQFHP
jgi:mevalonate kinase